MNDQDDIVWLKQQLVELQSQLAFQEDTFQILNDVVTRQQQQIEHLNELCNYNKSQLELLGNEGGAGEVQEDRPPHY